MIAKNCFGQKHIFYLHGRIVELQGANAIDSVQGFGAYRYNAILDSLRKTGFEVHSDVRPPSTQVRPYAEAIKNNIANLLNSGVKPADITVIGASKGALIAMMVSSLCKNENLNFVFMGACNANLREDFPDLEFFGNILSIYEKSDKFGASCEPIKKGAKHIRHYKELELQTGLKHGFIYQPLSQWVTPSLSWANGNYNP